MSTVFLSNFAASGATKTTRVVFDPDFDDSDFVLEVRPITPREIAKMTDDARNRRGRVNTVKINRALVDRFVIGWTGLTPEEAQTLGVLSFDDDGLEAAALALAPSGGELPFSKDQARDLMDTSIRFAGRVNELASELSELEDARRAYQKKASRNGSDTGADEKT